MSDNNEVMTFLTNSLMMYSALNLDDAEDSQEIKDLLDGNHRPANIASGKELLSEAVRVNPYTAGTMDLQTPASSTGYELTSFDRLDQLQLKAQCLIYKSNLEGEVDELKQVADVFSAAPNNEVWIGESASKFKEICGDYCIVIMCLQMAKLFDADDNNKLADRLGSEYLAGDMILYGIESSKAGYESECRARDHCNYMASNADDSETRSHYHSEACIHQALANSYYDEWQRYVGLKKEFEEIRAFSITFFTSGTPYRNYALKGMQLLATAFDGINSYTVPEGMSDWRKGVDEHHKLKMSTYTAKWKDENGDWDMDKLGEEIRIDDDSVSELDCLAMCYVFDDMYKQEDGLDKVTTLMSSSFLSSFEGEQGPYAPQMPVGYWTYRPSKTYCRVLSAYGNHLNETYSLNGSKCEGCEDTFDTYNLLSAGAAMTAVVPDYEHKECPDYNIDFEFSAKMNEDGYIDLNLNAKRYDFEYSSADRGTPDTYSSHCRVYAYSGDISDVIDKYSDEYTTEKLTVNTVAGELKAAGLTAVGLISTEATIGVALFSGFEMAANDVALAETGETMLYLDSVEDSIDEVNLGGSIIIKDDNEIIITAAVPGEDELSKYVDDYNADRNHDSKSENDFIYNPYTFAEQYMNDEDYRKQFDDFVKYVDSEKKSPS
ncbi:hypothetical protein [Pseudobutyrivibrio sp.]|uniref:hypothetical protein n=1 Tax=Pseudobutyrivibrio sp. TaxID=2014367 RepID=UPI003867E408